MYPKVRLVEERKRGGKEGKKDTRGGVGGKIVKNN
jgi:hypothetical protein